MSELKRIGFFRELRHGDLDGPSLFESKQTEPAVNEDLIVAYLLEAPLLVVFPGIVSDVIDQDFEIGPAHIHSDGGWIWPEDLAHYVERYHVRLPEEFTTHLAEVGFVIR